MPPKFLVPLFSDGLETNLPTLAWYRALHTLAYTLRSRPLLSPTFSPPAALNCILSPFPLPTCQMLPSSMPFPMTVLPWSPILPRCKPNSNPRTFPRYPSLSTTRVNRFIPVFLPSFLSKPCQKQPELPYYQQPFASRVSSSRQVKKCH